MKTSHKGFIAPLLLVLIALLLIGGAYVYMQKQSNQPVTGDATLPQSTSTVQTPTPQSEILSIISVSSPSLDRIAVGSTIIIKGKGFSYRIPEGQSGMNSKTAIEVVMQNSKGQRLPVFNSGGNASDSEITFTLPAAVCTFTEIGCDNSGKYPYTNITAGVYSLYVLIPRTGAVSNNANITVGLYDAEYR